MISAAITVYIVGCALTLWSASLTWRAIRANLVPASSRPQPPTSTSRARRRLTGLSLGIVTAVVGAGLLLVAEVMRAGLSSADYGDTAVFRGVGILVCILLAAGAVYAGWRFDPAHGRRRCRRCWYDMQGIASLTCPECGREAKAERDLKRTRRSKALIVLAPTFLISVYALVMAPRVREEGWVAAIPTTVLIIAWPWLPDEIVHHADGSLALRGDKWEWQEQFLRWRCSRIIKHTHDVGLLGSAVSLYDADWAYSRYPRISSEMIIRLVSDYCSGDEQAASAAGSLLMFAEGFVPETFDEQTSTRLIPIVAGALDHDSDAIVANGAQVAAHLGKAGEALVPRLESLSHRISERPPAVMALLALRAMAEENDIAIRAFLRLFDADDQAVQMAVCRLAARLHSRADVVVPKLLEKVDSSSDSVVGRAWCSLLEIGPEPCTYVPRILAVTESRPLVGAHVVVNLAAKCPEDAQVQALVEKLLSSDDSMSQVLAAQAAVHLGVAADRLLPVLRRLAELRIEDPDRAHAAERAIWVIEARLAATKRNP